MLDTTASLGKRRIRLPCCAPPCDLLGIQYPIFQAPMAGGWTTPALVSEVSDAGGLGMLATTGVVIGTYEPAGEIVTGSFALD
jgi:hypothetical protein